jgi:hypothetical protein
MKRRLACFNRTWIDKERGPFEVGDIVKYVVNEYGDDCQNPLWGGKYGNIEGTVIRVNRYGSRQDLKVEWCAHHDYGEVTNTYADTTLALVYPRKLKPSDDTGYQRYLRRIGELV